NHPAWQQPQLSSASCLRVSISCGPPFRRFMLPRSQSCLITIRGGRRQHCRPAAGNRVGEREVCCCLAFLMHILPDKQLARLATHGLPPVSGGSLCAQRVALRGSPRNPRYRGGRPPPTRTEPFCLGR